METATFKQSVIPLVLFIFLSGVVGGLYAGPPVSLQNYPTLASNTFIFYPARHKWVAVDNSGKIVRSGRASGGRGYCPDIHRSCRTPVGTFRVISEGGPGCRSSRYPVGHGGARMPYCMFFTKLYAIHGSDEVPNHNASHGCIRVIPSEARWLQRYFIKIGTKVVVKPY